MFLYRFFFFIQRVPAYRLEKKLEKMAVRSIWFKLFNLKTSKSALKPQEKKKTLSRWNYIKHYIGSDTFAKSQSNKQKINRPSNRSLDLWSHPRWKTPHSQPTYLTHWQTVMIGLIRLWQKDTFSSQCRPFSLHSLTSDMDAGRLMVGSASTSAYSAEKMVPKGDVVITANNRSIVVKCTGCHFEQLHVRISNAARQIITLSKRLIDTFKDSADSSVLEVAN